MAEPGSTSDSGELIEAVPLWRPGRWVAAAVILLLLGLFVYGAATNPNYQWDTYRKYLFDSRISSAAWNTLQLTFWAMLLGVVLGVLLAV
ncbi:MAG: polar amino acid transport system permease protein, partial [Pseudonocardiales bacterium]|nr:polar amino acid transport system permease protein [Pseudonocardiales bacterium]